MSSESNVNPRNRDWKQLQNWLDTSEYSRSRNWNGATIIDGTKTLDGFNFKVGFAELGRFRICAGNCRHNGGANKCWRIRVQDGTGLMESMCYQNNRIEAKCQSITRKKPWFSIVDMHGDRIRLGL